MIRIPLSVLMALLSTTLRAETLEVHVRYVEIDVTKRAKEIDDFEQEDSKLKAAREIDKRSAAAAKFFETLDELPVNYDIDHEVKLEKTLTAKSGIGKKNPANSVELHLHCEPLDKKKDVGVRIKLDFKADSTMQRYRRGATLDFTPEQMAGKRCTLLAIEKNREGESEFKSATFCVIEFKKPKSE